MDKLQRLIFSMDANEKRHFKLFSDRYEGKEKDYLKLFNAVASNPKKEVNSLKISHFPEFTTLKFSQLKNYLFKQIMRSLVVYNQDFNKRSILQNQLIEVGILYRKELYQDCEKLLKSAKKIAVAYEYFPELYEVLNWERLLLIVVSHDYEKLDSILQQTKDVLAKLKNRLSHNEFHHSLMRFVNTEYRLDSEAYQLKFETFANNPLLTNPDLAISKYALRRHYQSNSYYYDIIKDLETQHKYDLTLVELLEEDPKYLEENISFYINPALTSLTRSCQLLKKEVAFEVNALKIESLLEVHADKLPVKLYAESFFIVRFYRLYNFIQKGKFDRASESVPDFEQFISSYKSSISVMDELVSYFNFASAYFGQGNFTNALKWVNHILDEKRFMKVRADILAGTKIFFLIIHFELGNQELLDYAIKSTIRFLKKQKTLNPFEQTVLDWISKANISTSATESLTHFKELRHQLLELSKDPFNRDALRAYHIISWLDSKIEARAFTEVVTDKSSRGIHF